MNLKEIIKSVIIVVIALLIFSYIAEPSTKYKVNQFFSKAKNELSSNIEKMPTPAKITCEEKAKEIIPDVLILSHVPETQFINYWKDGQLIDGQIINDFHIALKLCFEKGSEDGENVNYYYMKNEYSKNKYHDVKCPNGFSYSKKIISKDGTVLGTRAFTFKPIIRIRDKQITTNASFNKDTDKFIFIWEGLDDEMKRYFGVDKVNYKMVFGSFRGLSRQREIICEHELKDIKGTVECDGSIVKNLINNTQPMFYDTIELVGETDPDISDNKIYEIIQPNIISCNWVEEK